MDMIIWARICMKVLVDHLKEHWLRCYRRMDMNKFTVSLCIIFLVIMGTFFLPLELRSEIYKYVDKDGTIHFVDDITKVPEEYRNQVDVREDKPKGPSGEETPTTSEGEAEDSAAKQLEKWREEKKREEEEKAREAYERGLETKVTISGNKVLVPATLGYIGYEVQVTLVLDTGADLLTLHQPIADQLRLPTTQKAQVRVVGGKKIQARLVQLDYARVGPYEARNIQALIISHQDPSAQHDGLLGMNFLRGLDYKIDFDNQMIIWRP